mmetsp:Transcript_146592/g.365551  ORF Transcript_146592/g.365551 Transcript_146592/m.365551 type:complete len:250 (-) Transcript_146592:98-847(-)
MVFSMFFSISFLIACEFSSASLAARAAASAIGMTSPVVSVCAETEMKSAAGFAQSNGVRTKSFMMTSRNSSSCLAAWIANSTILIFSTGGGGECGSNSAKPAKIWSILSSSASPMVSLGQEEDEQMEEGFPFNCSVDVERLCGEAKRSALGGVTEGEEHDLERCEEHGPEELGDVREANEDNNRRVSTTSVRASASLSSSINRGRTRSPKSASNSEKVANNTSYSSSTCSVRRSRTRCFQVAPRRIAAR